MKAISSKKSINTVKTADIINLINGVNMASEKAEKTAEYEGGMKKEENWLPEGIFYDEEHGVYIDAEGNILDIEEVEYIMANMEQ